MKRVEDYVRSIPDFPEPGIIFRDITSVLQDADGLQLAIDSMQACLKDTEVDVIAGTESRGFIFGVPIAYNLHKPFVPVRKKGKLPCETISASYDLEYGKPITVGSNCWFGSNVTVCGGVTIGEGCVIGAGSVVTKDIPPHSLAVGNPCRVLREITEKDSVQYKPELF